MAENDKEIIDQIGRRLREAADAGQAGPLPQSIQASLERLNDIETVSEAGQDGPHRRRRPEQETSSIAALPHAE